MANCNQHPRRRQCGFQALESASDIASGNWNPVLGVANNSKVVPLTAGNQFFRLKK